MSAQIALDLNIPAATTCQKRDFHGIAQFREAVGDALHIASCRVAHESVQSLFRCAR